MTFKGLAALVSPFLAKPLQKLADDTEAQLRGPSERRPARRPRRDLAALAAARPAARRPARPRCRPRGRRRRRRARGVRGRPGAVGPGRRRTHRVAGGDAARRPSRRTTGGSRSGSATRAPWSRGWPRDLGATSVHVSAEPFPYGRRRDAAVARALARDDVAWVETGSPYAVTPGRVRKGDGSPYQVFTPFSRAWREHGWRGACRRAVRASASPRPTTTSASPRCSTRRCATARTSCPTRVSGRHCDAGRSSGTGPWTTTTTARDLPAKAGTSGLSPYLKVGAVHPRTLLADLDGTPQQGRHDVRRRAGLARVLRRRALAPSRVGVARPARGARRDAPTTTPATRSTRGARAAPATRSSTPGCASCSPPAGCTTGCA